MTTNKKLDPKQLFTISTISRGDLAGLLNDAIDTGAFDVKKFTRDDPRLTDEVCKKCAKSIYRYEAENLGDQQIEVYEAAIRRALETTKF